MLITMKHTKIHNQPESSIQFPVVSTNLNVKSECCHSPESAQTVPQMTVKKAIDQYEADEGCNLRQKQHFRRGKWTPEEEAFAERLIKEFDRGYLDIQCGTTLRNFLSSKLNCDPMRITKRYSGSSAIGKRTYRVHGKPPNFVEEIRRVEKELFELEKNFFASLNKNKTCSNDDDIHDNDISTYSNEVDKDIQNGPLSPSIETESNDILHNRTSVDQTVKEPNTDGTVTHYVQKHTNQATSPSYSIPKSDSETTIDTDSSEVDFSDQRKLVWQRLNSINDEDCRLLMECALIMHEKENRKCSIVLMPSVTSQPVPTLPNRLAEPLFSNSDENNTNKNLSDQHSKRKFVSNPDIQSFKKRKHFHFKKSEK